MQHGESVGVRESHARETDVGLGALEDGVAFVHLGVGVEDVEDSVGRSHRPLIQVEGLAETGERPQQALCEEHQHRVGRRFQGAVECSEPSDQHRDQEPGQDPDSDHRDERGGQSDGTAIDGAVRVRLGHHSLAFPPLGGERLDGGDPAEVVVQDPVEGAGLLADCRVPGRHQPGELDRPPDEERDRDDGQHRHRGRQDEEDCADPGTAVTVWIMSLAPTSRNRSNWFTSSFRTAMSPPVDRSSK
jgi:hypothetical protein